MFIDDVFVPLSLNASQEINIKQMGFRKRHKSYSDALIH